MELEQEAWENPTLQQRVDEATKFLQGLAWGQSTPQSIESWYHDAPLVMTRHRNLHGVDYSFQIRVTETNFIVTMASWYDDENSLTRFHGLGLGEQAPLVHELDPGWFAAMAKTAEEVKPDDLKRKKQTSSLSAGLYTRYGG